LKAECVFCQIVSGAVAAFVVYEDEISIAFLDDRPLFPGHCLLIPKQHIETLAELSAEVVGPFFQNAQRLAGVVERAMKAEGSFVAINNRVSQSVPHLHVHIVPRRRKDGLRGFFWPRNRYKNDDEMREAQRAIRTAVEESD
jgi:histidine triad (HIT) family protein